jgi:hypothetical protein
MTTAAQSIKTSISKDGRTATVSIYAHDPRYIGLRDSVGGHGFDLTAQCRVRLVRPASHQLTFSPRRSPATSANDRPSWSSLASSPVKACQRSTATST